MTMFSEVYLISTTRTTPRATILAYVKLRRSFKLYFAISAFLLLQVFLSTAMIFLSLYSYISFDIIIRIFSYISSVLQKTNILRWPPLLHRRIIIFSPCASLIPTSSTSPALIIFLSGACFLTLSFLYVPSSSAEVE